MRLLYKTTVRGRNVSYVTIFNFVGDSRAKCRGGRKNYRMKGRESDIGGTSKFLVILQFSFLLLPVMIAINSRVLDQALKTHRRNGKFTILLLHRTHYIIRMKIFRKYNNKLLNEKIWKLFENIYNASKYNKCICKFYVNYSNINYIIITSI